MEQQFFYRFGRWTGLLASALLRFCLVTQARTDAANSPRVSFSQLRFNRRIQKEKRAIVVAVRNASGLPVGDPVSRKCHPYVIITVLECSR